MLIIHHIISHQLKSLCETGFFSWEANSCWSG